MNKTIFMNKKIYYHYKSKKEGKVHTSTTPDPGHN